MRHIQEVICLDGGNKYREGKDDGEIREYEEGRSVREVRAYQSQARKDQYQNYKKGFFEGKIWLTYQMIVKIILVISYLLIKKKMNSHLHPITQRKVVITNPQIVIAVSISTTGLVYKEEHYIQGPRR